MFRTSLFRGASAIFLLFSSSMGCGTISGTAAPDPGAGVADPGATTPGGSDPGTPAPKTPPPVQPLSQTVSARDAVPESLRQALSTAEALDGAGLQQVYPSPT